MTPTCPKCRTTSLHPISGSRPVLFGGGHPNIPPSRCEHCRGVWLPHEAIHTGVVPAASEEVADSASAEADGKAGFCPNGHGFLTRARVERTHPFHLDRCSTCAGVWFDAGEWATIASSAWLQHLDDLWDPVYRKRMREERAQERHLETLRHALGEDAFEKVIAAAAALRSHPMKSLALAYILDETRTQAHH